MGSAAVAASVLIYFSRPTCESVLGAPSEMILCVCGGEYRKTGNPEAGIRYADQLQKKREFEQARAVAGELLLSSQSPNAWRVLGYIARKNDDLEGAARAFEVSRDLNVARHAPSAAARADQALIGVRSEQGDLIGALRTAQRCIEQAEAGPERRIESYCRLSASEVLVAAGYLELAKTELDTVAAIYAASPQEFTPYDQFSLTLSRASRHQFIDREPLRPKQHQQAVALYQKLLEPEWIKYAEPSRLMIELNLADSLARDGKPEEAEPHLAAAHKLDEKNRNEVRLKQIGARIAFGRNDLARAAGLNGEIYDKAEAQDQKLDIAIMQARIALRRDDFVDAERWASRGIEQVEKLRAEQSIELRSWVLSTRRDPYELRFVSLARAKRTDDAIMALDAWHGRTVADGLARGRGSPADLASAVQLTRDRLRWLPTVSTAPIAADASRAAVLATLRTIDVLALVVADGDMWRLTAIGGTLALDNLGPYAALSDQLQQFPAHVNEPTAAKKLGARLLPVDLFQGTRTLHVLLDGPFSSLPVAALRRGDQALVSFRPVLRIPRLPEVACVPAVPPDHATLLADPDGSLHAARREIDAIARIVARKLNLIPVVSKGETATSAALFAASRTGVVHLDVHGVVGDIGGVLKLYDRDVSALEILSRRFGPRLVVMTACVSAISNDAEVAASLSSAFLASGSVQVIATLRDVDDEFAGKVAITFYEHGGATDPIRALQKTQSELFTTNNTAWPFFAVFGHEVCPSSPLTP
ncbi:MAG: CHAT domain-containing protein [Myxococcales bacterium]|nr:CHAT domain-containing protein [Myxococcales bacterium]